MRERRRRTTSRWRAAKEKDTGKKPRGKPPEAPKPGPKDSDQINLTDEESRIMPVPAGHLSNATTPRRRWMGR